MKKATIYLVFLTIILQACDTKTAKRYQARLQFGDLENASAAVTSMTVTDSSEVVYLPEIDEEHFVDYKEITDTVFVVRLETSDSCLIGKTSKISLHNDTIYILDKNQSLFMFSPDGRFLCKIGNKGQGPGEYVEPTDYFVDDKIYIWDNWQNKISVYNKNGKFIFDKIVPFLSFQIGKLNPNTFIFRAFNNYNLHIPQLDDYCVWTTDTNFNILKSGMYYKNESGIFPFDDNGMRKIDQNYYSVYEQYSDSMFLITPDCKLICRFILKYNGNRYLDKITNKTEFREYFNKNDYLLVKNCIFNKYYLLAQLFQHNKGFGTMYYSSLTKKVFQISTITFGDKDCLCPNLETCTFYNNYFVHIEEPSFIAHQKTISKYVGGDFSDIKEDDNPILIFYKLK